MHVFKLICLLYFLVESLATVLLLASRGRCVNEAEDHAVEDLDVLVDNVAVWHIDQLLEVFPENLISAVHEEDHEAELVDRDQIILVDVLTWLGGRRVLELKGGDLLVRHLSSLFKVPDCKLMAEVLVQRPEDSVQEGYLVASHHLMLNAYRSANELHHLLYVLVAEEQGLIHHHEFLGEAEEVTCDEWEFFNLVSCAQQTHTAECDRFISFQENLCELLVPIELLQACLERKDESRVWVQLKLIYHNLYQIGQVVQESVRQHLHQLVDQPRHTLHQPLKLRELKQD